MYFYCPFVQYLTRGWTCYRFRMFNLFRHGQSGVSRIEFEEYKRVAETRVQNLESVLRQYQDEQVTMHAQVHKWMRRALAAESRGRVEKVTVATQEPPVAQEPIWGPLARIRSNGLHDAQPTGEER